MRTHGTQRVVLNTKLWPEMVCEKVTMIVALGRIPDIQLIYNAGYLVSGQISGQHSISGKLLDNRISHIRNQPDIRYPDSFNIWYLARYWKWLDIWPSPSNNDTSPDVRKGQRTVNYPGTQSLTSTLI